VMTKPFNPSKFVDMLDKSYYATGPKGDELKSEREGLVAWLRKKGKNSQACLDLADKLAQCRRRHRCRSAACPECATAGQSMMAGVARRFLKKQVSDGTKIVCVTIIPADGMIKQGKLSRAEHERAVRRWKDRLGKAGVEWSIGATDFSMNEHKQDSQKPRWSVHIHGITVNKNPKKLKRALKKQFPKTKGIRRPVMVDEWDGDKKALRYIFKPNYSRRIATDDAQRYDKKTGTMRKCRDTDPQPLKSKQKRELLLHLDGIGMQSRLLMRCCQLLNAKSKGPTIVLRLPKGPASR
jgi:hypothetical protein